MIYFKLIINAIRGTFGEKFTSDAFWALLGNILAKGLSLAGVIIVARVLEKESFGHYGTIKSTLMNLAIFSTFGLGYTATKFVSQYQGKKEGIIGIISNYSLKISLVVSSILAIILFVFSDYVAKVVLDNIELSIPLKISSIWIILNSITAAQVGLLAGISAYKELAKIGFFVGLVSFIASVVLTIQFKLYGALVSLIISQTLYCLLNQRLINSKHTFSSSSITDLRLRSILFKKLLSFSFPVALQEVAYSILSWIMILVLVQVSTYSEVGIYSAALQWFSLILFVPGILRNVILNHLSSSIGDEKEHDKILAKTIIVSLIATIIPVFVVMLFQNQIVSFYGESYGGELNRVIIIMAISALFVSVSNVYSQAYLSKERNWTMLTLRIFRDLGIVVGTYVLITQFSTNGALALSLNMLFANIVFLLLMAFIYHVIIKS